MPAQKKDSQTTGPTQRTPNTRRSTTFIAGQRECGVLLAALVDDAPLDGSGALGRYAGSPSVQEMVSRINSGELAAADMVKRTARALLSPVPTGVERLHDAWLDRLCEAAGGTDTVKTYLRAGEPTSRVPSATAALLLAQIPSMRVPRREQRWLSLSAAELADCAAFVALMALTKGDASKCDAAERKARQRDELLTAADTRQLGVAKNTFVPVSSVVKEEVACELDAAAGKLSSSARRLRLGLCLLARGLSASTSLALSRRVSPAAGAVILLARRRGTDQALVSWVSATLDYLIDSRATSGGA